MVEGKRALDHCLLRGGITRDSPWARAKNLTTFGVWTLLGTLVTSLSRSTSSHAYQAAQGKATKRYVGFAKNSCKLLLKISSQPNRRTHAPPNS